MRSLYCWSMRGRITRQVHVRKVLQGFCWYFMDHRSEIGLTLACPFRRNSDGVLGPMARSISEDGLGFHLAECPMEPPLCAFAIWRSGYSDSFYCRAIGCRPPSTRFA